MRYYKLDLSRNGQPIFPSSLQGEGVQGFGITSLLPNGQFNPSALAIEFDIPVAQFHTPAGAAWIRVWGLGLKDIGAAFDLGATPDRPGADVALYGGMSAGLPLASPAQAGLLISGSVLQSYGNWLGTEMTLDLILAPAVGTSTDPMNFVLNWQAGTTLADALRQTLSTALPKAQLSIQISPRLVQNHDEVGFYGSLTQLASLLNPLSKFIVTDAGYQGVSITYDGVDLKVFDNTTLPAPKQIQFQDLLGQPTRIGPGTVQAKLVLRGDLDIGDVIHLPPSLVTTTTAAVASLMGSNPSNFTTFSGNFSIQQIHHWGSSRQPDAMSWNTTVDMIPVQ